MKRNFIFFLIIRFLYGFSDMLWLRQANRNEKKNLMFPFHKIVYEFSSFKKKNLKWCTFYSRVVSALFSRIFFIYKSTKKRYKLEDINEKNFLSIVVFSWSYLQAFEKSNLYLFIYRLSRYIILHYIEYW